MRFLLRDTTEAGALLTDEEIAFLLAQRSNVYSAAAEGAMSIASKHGATLDRTIGDLRLTQGAASTPLTNYLALSKQLKMQGALGTSPFTGGISKADKDSSRADADWDRGDFQVGAMDEGSSVTITDTTL